MYDHQFVLLSPVFIVVGEGGDKDMLTYQLWTEQAIESFQVEVDNQDNIDLIVNLIRASAQGQGSMSNNFKRFNKQLRLDYECWCIRMCMYILLNDYIIDLLCEGIIRVHCYSWQS